MQTLQNKSIELKEWQDAEDPPEIVATIPALSIEDIKETETVEYPINVTLATGGVHIVSHELPTSISEILYVDIGFDISHIPFDDIPLLNFFGRLITELGTKNRTDVDLMQMVGMYTGGISPSLFLQLKSNEDLDERTIPSNEHLVTKLFLRGKASISNIDHLFYLLNTMMKETELDNRSKVFEIVKETCAEMSSKLISSGHSIVHTRIRSHYSVTGFLDEMLEGVNFLKWSQNLLNDIKHDWESVLQRLEGMRNIILDDNYVLEGMIINLTGNKRTIATAKKYVERYIVDNFLKYSTSNKMNLNAKKMHPWFPEIQFKMNKITNRTLGFAVPTQVSYVGKGLSLYEIGEKVHGSIAVLSHYLKTGYLWEQVRVQGGAYGAFSSLSINEGVLSFISYRDPNLDETIKVYDNMCSFLSSKIEEWRSKTDKILEMQIIGTIGSLDGSVLQPANQGWVSMTRWLRGESAATRRRWRREIINTTLEDIIMLKKRLDKAWQRNATVAIASNKDKLQLSSVVDNNNIQYL